MTQVGSMEVKFKNEGSKEVVTGFEQIARAAQLAKREAQVAQQNMRDDAKKLILTEKEKVAAYVKSEREAAAAVRKSAQEQKQAHTEMMNGMKNFAVGIVAAGVALKKFYDVAKEGAALEFTAIKFDRLAQSVGTTGDVLLGKMKEATKGTMSDMEAMGAATDLMSLGLAKSSDEAVRLAAVQSGLAMDTNNLVLTLTNMRTMRFDQLGVSVDGFKERLDGLKETMKGASEQDIFKEAFLQQAEAQLLKVGNAADTSAGQYAKFEANVKNATDRLKEQAAQALLPLIESTNKHADALAEINKAYADGRITEEEHDKLIRSMSRGYRENDEVLAELNNTMREAAPNLDDLENGFYKVRDAVQEVSMDYGKQVGLVNSMQSAEESYTEKSNDLAEDRAEAEAKLQELRAQGHLEQSEQIQDQLVKIDEIKQKEAELEQERARQSLQFVSNILAENLARDGWTENEFNAFAEQQEAWGLWSADVVEKSKAAWMEADKITASINAIPSEKIVNIKIFANPVQIGNMATEEYQNYVQGEKQYAAGGSFTIPQAYGYEGFNMGGMATASGGETVTITPAGQQSGMDTSGIINAINQAFNMPQLARTIVQAMQQAA